MIERGYGKIINLSSTWSASTDVGKSVYGIAKAGVSYMTAALSTEWAPFGVRVNAIAPTSTLTENTSRTFRENEARAQRLLSRIKLGRFAQPSDLVGAAIFLASPASDFVTGHTLFRRRRLARRRLTLGGNLIGFAKKTKRENISCNDRGMRRIVAAGVNRRRFFWFNREVQTSPP